MKSLTAPAVAILSFVLFAPVSSLAQVPGNAPASAVRPLEADKLPIALEGTVTAEGGTFNLSWKVLVEERRSDGAILGKMIYSGRTCSANNAPFNGTFDGTILKLNMPFEQSNPFCKGWVFQLAWSDSSRRFDGRHESVTQSNRPVTLLLTLVPVPK